MEATHADLPAVLTKHALSRLAGRGITPEAIGLALRCGRRRWSHGACYERHITHGEARHHPALRPWVGLCVLHDETSNTVVTAYWEKGPRKTFAALTSRTKVFSRAKGRWVECGRRTA